MEWIEVPETDARFRSRLRNVDDVGVLEVELAGSLDRGHCASPRGARGWLDEGARADLRDTRPELTIV